MRRSAARSLLNSGVSEIDVTNTTGHKTASMLRRYAIFDLRLRVADAAPRRILKPLDDPSGA